MPKIITAKAPARVVLFLQIGGDADSHTAEAQGLKQACLYQAVGLYNEVSATAAEDWSEEVVQAHCALDVLENRTIPLIDPVKELAQLSDKSYPVCLRVLQRIPIGIGLGGWSASIAAALTACNKLWGSGISRDKIIDIASKYVLKSPISVYGGAAAYQSGQDITPAIVFGTYHWVLAWDASEDCGGVKAGEFTKHRDLHKAYLGGIPATVQVENSVFQAIRGGDLQMLGEVAHNDLQAVAMSSKGHIRDILEAGESNGAIAGIVSENGASTAFLLPDKESAENLQKLLRKLGCEAVYAEGPAQGATVIPNNQDFERLNCA